jgi:hypothetical protein
MSGYDIAHQFRTQHLMEEQAKSIERLAAVAKAQAESGHTSQRLAAVTTVGSLVVAAGSLVVAVLVMILE